MAYTPPNFNLALQLWHTPHTPFGDPVDVFGLRGQLYRWPKDGSSTSANLRILRVQVPPPDPFPLTVGDIWEAPTGSLRFYQCVDVWIEHEAFPNQYIAVLCKIVDGNGMVIDPHLP
jgi:hypothetical protein